MEKKITIRGLPAWIIMLLIVLGLIDVFIRVIEAIA